MEKNDYLQRLLDKVHVRFVNDPLPADLRTRFPDIKGPLGKDLTYDELNRYPGLQEALAFILRYTPSKWLLEQEAPEIRKRRILHQWRPDTRDFKARTRSSILHRMMQETSTVGPATARFQEYASPAVAFEAQPSTSAYCRAWPRGDRSINSTTSRAFRGAAIFTPGWPPGLSAGPWKSATKISGTRASQDDLRAAWNHVTYRLTPLPGRNCLEKYQMVWPRQIQWLRRYSNYLTPQVGLFTSDTWSAVAMWIRNSALNQTLLIAMFLCLLCFPHLLAPSVRLGPNPSVANATGTGAVGLAAGVVPKASPPGLVNTTKPAPTKISPDRYFRSLFLKYWHGRWNLAGIVSFFYKVAGAGKTIIAALFCFATGIALVISLLRWEYDLAVQPLQSRKAQN